MSAKSLLPLLKRGMRMIYSEMPWEQHKLKKEGLIYTKNFSDEGDAKFVPWTCETSEEHGPVVVHTRHFEYAYAVDKIHELGNKSNEILDVGSAGSLLPTVLAAMGNHVVCIDVREWPIKWPNLDCIKADLFNSELPVESFDAITCVSTMEHFGIGRYGDVQDVDGDIKGMAVLKKYLKPGGLLIITVPYGQGTVAFPAHRVYNRSRFSMLTAGFKVLEQKFFGPIENRRKCRPCSEEETYRVDTGKRIYASGCALLEKVKE